MKKSVLIFAVLGVLMTALFSCGGDNKIKDVRVLVASFEKHGDTLNVMNGITSDGETLLFSLRDVRLNNGLMVQGDSVIVNYIKGREG